MHDYQLEYEKLERKYEALKNDYAILENKHKDYVVYCKDKSSIIAIVLFIANELLALVLFEGEIVLSIANLVSVFAWIVIYRFIIGE